MAISERDLKLLWGRAAGRCSVCKVRVTEDKQSVTDAFPFGENAHIISEKPSGPRGNTPILDSLRNNYWNLILLCPNCHTKIDKAPEDYPVERLHKFKQVHESEMDRLHPYDKASYDQMLGFSRITGNNWLSPDRENYIPFGVAAEQWGAAFVEPRLEDHVPLNVIRVFEVARASMIYSWFFYPLATLGFEQLQRVGEFAIHERCRMLPLVPSDLDNNLKALVSAKVISTENERRWRCVCSSNHDFTRLAGLTLDDPGQAIGLLQTVSEMINGLFSSHAKQD